MKPSFKDQMMLNLIFTLALLKIVIVFGGLAVAAWAVFCL